MVALRISSGRCYGRLLLCPLSGSLVAVGSWASRACCAASTGDKVYIFTISEHCGRCVLVFLGMDAIPLLVA